MIFIFIIIFIFFYRIVHAAIVYLSGEIARGGSCRFDRSSRDAGSSIPTAVTGVQQVYYCTVYLYVMYVYNIYHGRTSSVTHDIAVLRKYYYTIPRYIMLYRVYAETRAVHHRRHINYIRIYLRIIIIIILTRIRPSPAGSRRR